MAIYDRWDCVNHRVTWSDVQSIVHLKAILIIVQCIRFWCISCIFFYRVQYNTNMFWHAVKQYYMLWHAVKQYCMLWHVHLYFPHALGTLETVLQILTHCTVVLLILTCCAAFLPCWYASKQCNIKLLYHIVLY